MTGRLEEPSEETPNKREGNYLWFPWQPLVSLAEKLPNADVFPAVGPSSDWVVVLEQHREETRIRCKQKTDFLKTRFVPYMKEQVEFLQTAPPWKSSQVTFGKGGNTDTHALTR